MIEIPVTVHNYRFLPRIVDLLIKQKETAICIKPVDSADLRVPYHVLKPYIYAVLEREDEIDIEIKNIPLCHLENAEDHNVNSEKRMFPGKCGGCAKKAMCSGVPEVKGIEEEVTPVLDKPREIIIELTSKCNFDCHFCFNKNSHAPMGVRTNHGMTTQQVKYIIDQAVENDIGIVRFSGGEPLLRSDVAELCKYAKDNGREVRINTNGTLVTPKFLEKAERYIDNMLIALNTHETVSHTQLSGLGGSFESVINGMKAAKKSSIPVVRSGTCMTAANIENLEIIYDMIINKLELHDWEVYRPVAHPHDRRPTTREHMIKLVNKLSDIKGKDKAYFVVNAFPYCVMGKDKELMKQVRSICVGARYDDGHTRMVVDPSGVVHPSYYLTENIGTYQDIMGAWNHPFLQGIRAFKSVPSECNSCPMIYNCKGGSRFHAKLEYGSYDAPDPLMHNAPVVSSKLRIIN